MLEKSATEARANENAGRTEKKKKKTVVTLAQTTLNKLKGEMRIRPLKQRPSLRQHSHGGRAERIYFKVAPSRGSR